MILHEIPNWGVVVVAVKLPNFFSKHNLSLPPHELHKTIIPTHWVKFNFSQF